MTLLENETGYIAGVTNPMFLQSTKYFEVCCLVDEGKLKAADSYWRQPYCEIDMYFINCLLTKA